MMFSGLQGTWRSCYMWAAYQPNMQAQSYLNDTTRKLESLIADPASVLHPLAEPDRLLHDTGML